MRNIIDINGYKATVTFEPEIEMLRGDFIGLNGGADFYADNVKDLYKEGEISLKVFLDMCRERGITPRKSYSGKFQVRLSPEEHELAAELAAARGESINQLIKDSLSYMRT